MNADPASGRTRDADIEDLHGFLANRFVFYYKSSFEHGSASGRTRDADLTDSRRFFLGIMHKPKIFPPVPLICVYPFDPCHLRSI